MASALSILGGEGVLRRARGTGRRVAEKREEEEDAFSASLSMPYATHLLIRFYVRLIIDRLSETMYV